MVRTVLVAAAILTLGGCKKVREAPAELDELLHWFWANYEDGDDEILRDAIANLHLAIDGDVLSDKAIDGFLTGIDASHHAVVGVTGPDPSLARGWYMARSFTCSVGQLEKVLVDLDQMSLYPGVYEGYERRYLTDAGDYLDRSRPDLRWEVDIVGDYFPLGYYEEDIEGGIRRVEPVESDDPHGTALLTRTWMTAPARFDKDRSWPQDFQIEVFWPRGNEILHVYGVWREMELGSGFSTNSDAFVRITLNNMAKWDDQTEALCAEGRP